MRSKEVEIVRRPRHYAGDDERRAAGKREHPRLREPRNDTTDLVRWLRRTGPALMAGGHDSYTLRTARPRGHALATACGEALLQLHVFCPRLHEGTTPVEHVGALVGALDALDGVS